MQDMDQTTVNCPQGGLSIKLDKIRKRNKFLINIIESLSHPFYVININDYTLELANSAAVKSKIPLGSTCFSVIHNTDQPCRNLKQPCPIEKVKNKKGPVTVEHIHYDNDGNPKNVEVHAHPILDDEGNVIQIIEYLLDITERKKAEEKMKKKLMRYKIEGGQLYLTKEPAPTITLEAFKDMIDIGFSGIVISRMHEDDFRKIMDVPTEYYWLAENCGLDALSPSLNEIESKINNLSSRHIVVIDRLDYLILKNGFDETLHFVHRLRENAHLQGHIILISVDPHTLSLREKRSLEKEARELEPRDDAPLSGQFIDILKIVKRMNTMGEKPSYSLIGLELSITKPTARKRIRHLKGGGYLRVEKIGRTKVLELTEKGRALFSR